MTMPAPETLSKAGKQRDQFQWSQLLLAMVTMGWRV